MKQSLGARTIIYPAPVMVVGTYDSRDRPNVMTAAWGGICCSQPPCLCVGVREQRYTYEALTARRAFTISLPDRAHAAAADYFGMVSGRDADKFARTGLTAARSRLVDAPYVAEFPLIVECVLRGTMDLGAHTLFVGEIVDVRVEEALLGADGHPDLEKMEPIAFMPGNDYYGFSGRVAAAFSAGAMYCGENQEG